MSCELCPRGCAIDRDKQIGVCGVSDRARIGKIMLHRWEEPCISGTRGSGAIFFAGCGLGCVYCQNYELSRGRIGTPTDARRLADCMRALQERGAHNINLVTATQSIPTIERALGYFRPSVPIVYNCGGYERVETLRRIADWVDVWLPDWKYASRDLAAAYSRAPDYPDVAARAIAYMRALAPDDVYDADGLMLKGMIVRHLVLPGALSDTRAVLDAIARTVGTRTRLSLMGQYTPIARTLPAPLDRKLKPLEYKAAISYALRLGFDDALVQEEDCADAQYIPEFDGTLTV